tara:strand:+ start:133 stop:621 length:489 start_codon:yes stop_codon:yes gene_type:complete
LIVGIVGDTHNNLKNISRICEIFNEEKVDLVIHTGDITLPKSLKAFEKLNCQLLGVFGNNDIEEKKNLLEVAKDFECNLYDEPYFMRLNNKRICVLHHPELINRNLILQSDFIFHGHTHRYRNEIINETTIFNPGECAGFLEGKNQIGIVDIDNSSPKVLNF